MIMSNCFLSHQLSHLAREMGNCLYKKKELSRKIVITSHDTQKEYLTRVFTHRYGISMGMQWLHISDIPQYLFSITGQNSYKFPSTSLLTLHIEQEIKLALTKKNPLFSPLEKYLDSSVTSLRLYKISNYLASLFLRYGNVTFEILEPWLKKEEWPQELFSRLMSHWEFPCTFIKKSFKMPFPLEIHFFHCSYISKTWLEFFHTIRGLTCYFYIFSPTSLYWGDLCSDRKTSYLSQTYLRRRVPEKYILALNSYLAKNDGFLSNLAEFGQPLLNYALEMNWNSREDFSIENKDTLLNRLQRNLLSNTFEIEQNSGSIDRFDDSIQVHKAISILQEIEILYNRLGKIIEEDPSLALDDIMVVAPNIETYAPLISFVFVKENNDLPFEINGNIQQPNEIFQGIIQILQLVESSLDLSFLRSFFYLNVVQKRFSLSESEVQDFLILAEKMNVSWGFNVSHRIKILNASEEDSEIDESGTWVYFFDRIIYGFCMAVDSRHANCEGQIDYKFLPSCNLAFTKAPQIGIFYTILKIIYENICSKDREEMSLEEWMQLLLQWIDQLLIQEFHTSDEGVKLKRYLCKLYKLPSSCRGLPISFISFSRFLQSILQDSPRILDRTGKIYFCSLEQGKIYPSKIVCILGFDEENFPRKQQENSLNTLKTPELTLLKYATQDRFCFLEVLHQVSDKLLFFFNTCDSMDGKEKQYSHLISELFEYLDTQLKINSKRRCFIDHSLISHVETEKVLLLSYDNKYTYRLDQDLPSPSLGSLREGSHIINLFRLAKNPIHTYFQVNFGVFWKTEHARSKSYLAVSNLDRFVIKNSLFRYPSNYVLEMQQSLGKLPSGLFKRLAFQTVLAEEKKILKNLSEVERPIFSVCMHPNITRSVHLEDIWFLPSTLSKDICNFPLYGEIHNVSRSGLLCSGKIELSSLYKEWPRIVFFMSIIQKYCKCLPEVIFFEQKKKWEPPTICWENALREYVDYYKKAAQVISPLHPKWIPFFLSDQEEAWCKVVRSSEIDFGDNLQWLKDIVTQTAHLSNFYQKWYEYVHTELPCLLEMCKHYENI